VVDAQGLQPARAERVPDIWQTCLEECVEDRAKNEAA